MTGFFKRLFGFKKRRGLLVFTKEAWNGPRETWMAALLEEIKVTRTEAKGGFVHVWCESRQFEEVGAGEATPRYLPSVSMRHDTDGHHVKVSFRRMA
jgi:hypothetical protein